MNNTISGIMCFSVPDVYLNCEMAMKELFGIAEIYEFDRWAFSPVLRFSDTEVFSTRRSRASLRLPGEIAAGVVILLTTC